MRWTPAITATVSRGKGGEGKNERGGPLNILSALTHILKHRPRKLHYVSFIDKITTNTLGLQSQSEDHKTSHCLYSMQCSDSERACLRRISLHPVV